MKTNNLNGNAEGNQTQALNAIVTFNSNDLPDLMRHTEIVEAGLSHKFDDIF